MARVYVRTPTLIVQGDGALAACACGRSAGTDHLGARWVGRPATTSPTDIRCTTTRHENIYTTLYMLI